MEKIKVYQDQNKIFNLENKHIKTSSLVYIEEHIKEHGFIFVEDKFKKLNAKELLEIRVFGLKKELEKLYKHYPEIANSISDSKIVSRNIYNSDPEKFGVSFENKTHIYIPPQLFYRLYDFPIRHLNI